MIARHPNPTHTSLTRRTALGVLLLISITGCFDNNPYPTRNQSGKTFYYSYPAEAKYLDPVRAYGTGEQRLVSPVYEPPLQFHYLKRPMELIPRTTVGLPTIVRYDRHGDPLPADAPVTQVGKVIYTIKLKPGIQFQDHPCFAKKKDGTYRWHLDEAGTFPIVRHPHELLNDAQTTSKTRTLRAEDYVYQLKRMAHPMRHCPVRNVFELRIISYRYDCKKFCIHSD